MNVTADVGDAYLPHHLRRILWTSQLWEHRAVYSTSVKDLIHEVGHLYYRAQAIIRQTNKSLTKNSGLSSYTKSSQQYPQNISLPSFRSKQSLPYTTYTSISTTTSAQVEPLYNQDGGFSMKLHFKSHQDVLLRVAHHVQLFRLIKHIRLAYENKANMQSNQDFSGCLDVILNGIIHVTTYNIHVLSGQMEIRRNSFELDSDIILDLAAVSGYTLSCDFSSGGTLELLVDISATMSAPTTTIAQSEDITEADLQAVLKVPFAPFPSSTVTEDMSAAGLGQEGGQGLKLCALLYSRRKRTMLGQSPVSFSQLLLSSSSPSAATTASVSTPLPHLYGATDIMSQSSSSQNPAASQNLSLIQEGLSVRSCLPAPQALSLRVSLTRLSLRCLEHHVKDGSLDLKTIKIRCTFAGYNGLKYKEKKRIRPMYPNNTSPIVADVNLTYELPLSDGYDVAEYVRIRFTDVASGVSMGAAFVPLNDFSFQPMSRDYRIVPYDDVSSSVMSECGQVAVTILTINASGSMDDLRNIALVAQATVRHRNEINTLWPAEVTSCLVEDFGAEKDCVERYWMSASYDFLVLAEAQTVTPSKSLENSLTKTTVPGPNNLDQTADDEDGSLASTRDTASASIAALSLPGETPMSAPIGSVAGSASSGSRAAVTRSESSMSDSAGTTESSKSPAATLPSRGKLALKSIGKRLKLVRGNLPSNNPWDAAAGNRKDITASSSGMSGGAGASSMAVSDSSNLSSGDISPRDIAGKKSLGLLRSFSSFSKSLLNMSSSSGTSSYRMSSCVERSSSDALTRIPWQQVSHVEALTSAILCVTVTVHLGAPTADDGNDADRADSSNDEGISSKRIQPLDFEIYVLGCPASQLCNIIKQRKESAPLRDRISTYFDAVATDNFTNLNGTHGASAGFTSTNAVAVTTTLESATKELLSALYSELKRQEDCLQQLPQIAAVDERSLRSLEPDPEKRNICIQFLRQKQFYMSSVARLNLYIGVVLSAQLASGRIDVERGLKDSNTSKSGQTGTTASTSPSQKSSAFGSGFSVSTLKSSLSLLSGAETTAPSSGTSAVESDATNNPLSPAVPRPSRTKRSSFARLVFDAKASLNEDITAMERIGGNLVDNVSLVTVTKRRTDFLYCAVEDRLLLLSMTNADEGFLDQMRYLINGYYSHINNVLGRLYQGSDELIEVQVCSL